MAKKTNIKELSRRYTTAVFELARSQGKLDEVGKDLGALKKLLHDDEKMRGFLMSPLLKSAEQLHAVRELAKGQKFGALTTNLLLLVARNGRLQNLNDIIDAFQDKIGSEKNEVKVQIISAVKLEASQLEQITKDLTSKNGQNVKLEEVIRPEIIGGLIVKIGSRMFDYSVKSRLQKLKTKLQAAS